MNTHDPGKPNGNAGPPIPDIPDVPGDAIDESRIHALLEGELTPEEAKALKAAAREDSRLAEAIVAAWQLQAGLDELAVEKAPASLRKRLRNIPVDYGQPETRWGFGLAGWALSLGVVAVAAVSVALVLGPEATAPAPSDVSNQVANTDQERVAQARRDLAIAFHYLDKAGLRTSREIRSVLSEELTEPVKDNLSRHLPYMPQGPKEKQHESA